MKHRALLTRMFETAVSSALPEHALAGHLPPKPKGRVVVIGAGKGAAQLTQEFEKQWDGPVSGVVVTGYDFGHGVHTSRIELIEAAHPVPDRAGFLATQRVMAAVENLTPDDLVVALMTGGGSALLPAPLDGLTLEDEQALNQALLASGAPISAVNTIRKQFSAIKGGRLAKRAHPARVHTIVVSDIPGDNAAEVASGPTLPSHGGRADAINLVRRYRVSLTEPLRTFLENQANESPDPQDSGFAPDTHQVISSARQSLLDAGDTAIRDGWQSAILSDALVGESCHIGAMHGDIARHICLFGAPFPRGTAMLSGDETTVTLRPSPGRGGPNTEFLLAFAMRIDGLDGIEVLAADTDGIDGSETNAGVFADGTTCARLRARGLDPADLLGSNSAYDAFETLGDLFSLGPTGTNINDFRAILIQ